MCFLATRRSTNFCGALLISTMLTGCGSGEPSLDRQAIQGTVTREGQPIDSGGLMFESTGGGPGVTAAIIDGKYNVPKESGPIPGSYKVKITHNPRLVEEPGVPRKDWNMLPEDRFKAEQPAGGWSVTAEVKKDQSEPIDFKVGE